MIKRIMISGPESTGKSWLARELASRYHTVWVPERARSYLEEIKRPYREEDLLKIAREQLVLEDEMAKEANQLLFCDTGMLVLKVWSEHSYGRCHPWILEQLRKRSYAGYLLPNIDMPWQPDPQREHPELREYFFRLYQQELKSLNLPYRIVKGFGQDRLKNSVAAVEQLVN